MKKIQCTLNVEEGKQLIALGTCEHPLFKKAVSGGKILLKGGTTVSRIAEMVAGIPLRICGRITGRGTVSDLNPTRQPHSIIVERGKWVNADEDTVGLISGLGPGDLIVCGANAFDAEGRAAIMAGSQSGGDVGLSLSSWYTEGVDIIIPVGIEKMIPGNLDHIISKTGRKGKSLSWGMSVGLFPVKGEIITEIEAVKQLAAVECQAIGAGGLGEARGSVTMEVWGEDGEVDKIIQIVKSIKGSKEYISGTLASLVECRAICKSCGRHVGCGYKSKQLNDKMRTGLGIITIGQSPRDDLVPDIKDILGDDIEIIQRGALDRLTYEEVIENLAPGKDDTVLVTRMRDGRQVKIGERHILPLLQDCINEMDARNIPVTLLLCTGKFPEFAHKNLLIRPQEMLHSVISRLGSGGKVGLLLPDSDQAEQAQKWWSKSGARVVIEIASPYGEMKEIVRAATALKGKEISMIFMDCMGYTLEMKEKVKAITGKPVVLPRTLTARVIRELL